MHTGRPSTSGTQGRRLVSVIVPTRNRPETLGEALQSIAAQTYSPIEVVVVNDGGRDVQDVISRYSSKCSLNYIPLENNKGRSAARNIAIRAARGHYVAYLDDDDLFFPDHLETLVYCLESGGGKVAYTDAFRARQQRPGGVLRDLVALSTQASIKIALLYCLNVLLPRRVVGWLPEVTKRLAARRQQEFLTLNECSLDLFSRADGNTSW